MNTIEQTAIVKNIINKENCPDCWGYVEYNNELRSNVSARIKSKLGWIASYAKYCLGLK